MKNDIERLKSAVDLLKSALDEDTLDLYDSCDESKFYISIAGYMSGDYLDVYFSSYSPKWNNEIDLSMCVTECVPELEVLLSDYSDLFTYES